MPGYLLKGEVMARRVVHRRKKTPPKNKIHWEKIPWKPLLVALAVLLVISSAGFTFAATQESHDSFCGSCHTQPESTYLQRSTAPQPVDLASHHTLQKTRCIDCHSGRACSAGWRRNCWGQRMPSNGTRVQPSNQHLSPRQSETATA